MVQQASGEHIGADSTINPRVRFVRAVPGQVSRNGAGIRAVRSGSRIRLRLFEVTLALFLAGLLLIDVYAWLSPYNRLLGGILVVLAVSGWLGRGDRIPTEIVLFGAFIGWGFMTGFFAGNQNLVLGYVKLLSQELILAFALTQYVRERGTSAFVFFLLLVVPLCLFWYARSTGQMATAQEGGRGGSWRLTSFLANSNAVATLCLYGIFSVAYFLWDRKRQRLALWPLLALPFIASSLVATGSRKNLLVVGVFALMWALLTYGRAKKSRLRMVVSLVVVGVALYVAGRFLLESTRVGERFNQVASDPYINTTRFNLYVDGWRMFLQSPFQGVGLGNFVIYSSSGAYAHSDYMEVLATTGVVGFVLYFSIYFVLWRRLRRILKRHPIPTSRYVAGLYQAAIISLLALGLGVPNFLNPLHMYVIGVIIGHTCAMEQDLSGTSPAESKASRAAAPLRPASARRAFRPSL